MIATPLMAALCQQQLDEAAAILHNVVTSGQIEAATIFASQREFGRFMKAFGKAQDANAMFLLGSISKPICMTALMTLFDRGEFRLAEKSAAKIHSAVRGRGDTKTHSRTMTSAHAHLGIA